jgi:hypothetical protein
MRGWMFKQSDRLGDEIQMPTVTLLHRGSSQLSCALSIAMTPLDEKRLCTTEERFRWVAHMLQNRETGEWLMAQYRQRAILTRDVVVGHEQIVRIPRIVITSSTSS